ncbi:MAG: SRPBCC family protein [Balneola sp.]
MPKINVTRSTTIHSPINDVYSKLSDFNHWPKWSPWLIMEEGVDIKISEDAKYYEWKGDRVGEGNMSITLEDGNNNIEYDLTFLKPWKSEAKVKFLLSDNNDRTAVTWTMDSKLPFFMFWMKNMMQAYVGMDYERGLNLLKDYVEKGEVHSKLEFKGTSNFQGATYIGISRSCNIDEISKSMMEDFGKMENFMKEHQDVATGQAYTIYHKWDMVKGKANYTGCVGLTSIPDGLPDGFVSGKIPETKIYTLRHIGAYHHLGNAWSTLYNMHRGKEFKPVKGIHPFEHYISNPQETEEKDLITDVIFAIK